MLAFSEQDETNGSPEGDFTPYGTPFGTPFKNNGQTSITEQTNQGEAKKKLF